MSKVIYACLRNGSARAIADMERRAVFGASRIAPVDANIRAPRVVADDRSVVAVLNPSTTNLTEPGAVCLGHLFDDVGWNVVGGGRPEGTYAICRSNDVAIELLSDAVGSRTLWYFIDHSKFVASTSQRWIVAFLGNFEANPKVLTWMLTSGSLGPTDSWDSRLSRLQADSTLTVSLDTWTIAIESRDANFRTASDNPCDFTDSFRASLEAAFTSLKFDCSKWVLPLSGGFDSRAILCMLGHKKGLRTITWGTEASMQVSGSDAVVAARLAKALGVEHQYYVTDSKQGALADVFDKFVAYGEGRTDHVSGYLDGFAIWQSLVESGIEGIIRGDEGFGWSFVSSFVEARRSVGLLLWSDFSNLPDIEFFGLDEQHVPDFLRETQKETSALWRDRLYHQYRIPTILSALTDLKAPFVEIANPLLAHMIIRSVRTLPDHLRTNKKLFKEIVTELSPKVPYADSVSIAEKKKIMRSGEAVEILSDVINSEAARAIYPKSLLMHISQNMKRESSGERRSIKIGSRRRLRSLVPDFVKRANMKSHRQPVMDLNLMAFRVFITCSIYEKMKADAAAGKNAALP